MTGYHTEYLPINPASEIARLQEATLAGYCLTLGAAFMNTSQFENKN